MNRCPYCDDCLEWPTTPELQAASVEARLQPLRDDSARQVAALSWPGRLIYRAVLPFARL